MPTMISSRLRTYAVSMLALAAAIAVAALGAVSLARAVETFQPLGFEAHRAGGGWTVTAVTAVGDPETGLLPDDQILLAGGQEPEGLGTQLRDSAETALVVLRGGELVEVSYLRPALAIDWVYLILGLTGALYLLIGVYTLMREATREGRGEARLFYLWCLASAVVYLLTPSGVADAMGRALFSIEELARLLLPPLTLHLFLVFPRPLGVAGRAARAGGAARIRWIPFLYLPAAVLLTLQGVLMGFAGKAISIGSTGAALALLDRAEIIHLIAFAAAALAVLVFRLDRYRDWEEHRQLQWIAIGLGAGYAPFLVLYVVPYTFGLGLPTAVSAVAVASLVLVPLTFAWAILRYKLWDIGVILRDAASTTLTVVLAGGAFALAHLAISRGVPENFNLARDFLSFGSGLAIAGLLLPARRQVGSALERLHYGRSAAKRRALEKLGRELLHERDLRRLCRELLRDLEAALDLEAANLYLIEDGGRLRPVLRDPEAPEEVDVERLGPQVWNREVEALSGVALPADRLGPRQRLFIAGYRYVFPLVVRGTPVGMLVTTFRNGEIPLSSEDLELVRQLLGGAALAIENARLMAELSRQLDEVVRLQRFSQGIIESSPAGIAVLTSDHRIVSANAAFAELVRREPDSLPGAPIAEVMPIEPLPTSGGQLVEVSYCDATGEERHLQLSVAGFRGSAPAAGIAAAAQLAPYEESDGALALASDLEVLVVYDVSQRVAMERTLREQDRLAALGVLAAGVAHEVNTPITGISSYAQMLLADTPESDPRHAILKKVERQTFRAARIVNNLLEFARNRTDERGPVDVGVVLEEALDLVKEHRDQRGVALELELPPEPIVVQASDGELQQVFTNLALNAIDAMESGGTLGVRAGVDAGRAWIRVTDTGPGMAPEMLARIFEPFYSTKVERGGTGLGLAISHDIVRRHGGALEVTSEIGHGSIFTVELPLHRGEEAESGGAGDAGGPAAAATSPEPA